MASSGGKGGGGKGGSSGSSSLPSATDLISQQTKLNKDTALWNSYLNNVNQVTPYGNLTWNYIGDKGKPHWEAQVTLTPEAQSLLDQQLSNQNKQLDIGSTLLGQAETAYSTPYSYDGMPSVYGSDTTASLEEDALNSYLNRLKPQWSRDEESLRTRLINQGIAQGSEAYRREMEAFNQNKNDALSQAVLASQQYGSNALQNSLTQRNQAIGEYDAQRNAAANAYSALTQGVQVTNPISSFQSQSYNGIPYQDYIGLYNGLYNAGQAAANNQSSAKSNLLSTAGSLGGTALGTYFGGTTGGAIGGFLGSAAGSLFSDRRLKENIELVGTENGFNLYKFNYINVPEKTFIGVMADEVEKTHPEAVSESEGYKKVNYDMIGLKMREVCDDVSACS